MAHVLNLTVYKNGAVPTASDNVPSAASTINLNSGSVITLEYIPLAPETSVISTNDSLRDGSEFTRITKRNISETARIVLQPLKGTSAGSAASAMQTTIREIGKFFKLAEDFQKHKNGERVFVEFKPDGAASTFRSEILTGKIDSTPESFNWRWTGASVAEFIVGWNRRHYWEGPFTLAQTFAGNKYLTGPEVIAGSNANEMKLYPDEILGELPTPAWIQILNLDVRMKKVYMCNNVLSGSDFIYWIEAEDSTIGNPDTSSLTSSSNAHKSACTTSSTETDMFQWTLNPSTIEHAQGNSYHVIGLFNSAVDTSLKFRLEVRSSCGTESLWKGEQFTIGDSTASFVDLGVIKIPPKPLFMGDPDNIVLTITGQESGGWSASLDHIQFFEANNYRILTVTASSHSPIANVQAIVDDGENNLTYVKSNNDTDAIQGIITRGDPILLYPNRNQSLIMSGEHWTTGLAPGACGSIGSEISIRVFHRPRVSVV